MLRSIICKVQEKSRGKVQYSYNVDSEAYILPYQKAMVKSFCEKKLKSKSC